MKFQTNTTTRQTETPKFKIQILEYGKHLYDKIQLIIAPEFKEKTHHIKKNTGNKLKHLRTESKPIVNENYKWDVIQYVNSRSSNISDRKVRKIQC